MSTPSARSLHESLKNARDFVKRENGIIAPLPLSEEVLNPQLQDDLALRAYPLEDTDRCYPVDYVFPSMADRSELRYFEDGRQMTVQIAYIPTHQGEHLVILPVHYFVVAAVILERTGKTLRLWQAPKVRSGVLVQKSLVPDQSVLQRYEDAGLEVVDTESLQHDYYYLRTSALRKAKALRLEVEGDLIEGWRREVHSDDFLLIDGTLMNLRDEDSIRRCIGVSKSFGSRYFSISDHNRIMQMPEFSRSWSFRFHDPELGTADQRLGARERVSWYLRLRTRPNADPEFGLVRVEIAKHYADGAPDYAMRFSRSLLSERLPTSYPAPRWHNHLYPIHVCETYLTSILPSLATVNASVKG